MKIKLNLQKEHYILLGIWFLINFLQSVFTQLQSDESYYWMYSQNLAWGYFDHPPMVAFLIHLGYLLFHNELGVRLLFLVLSTISMAIIVNELKEKASLLFLSLFILSFPLVHTHISGFLALPDGPLVFFTLLFFIVYRKFLDSPGILKSVVLAFIAAAMIYSKYHAFLILFFIVLSNLKLLKNKYFWLIVFITLLLLLPHIWWQIENHFPTLKYHLHDRSKPFRLKYVYSNIFSQLAVAGPLTGILIFWNLRKFRIEKDLYKKALIFNIAGFYIFFFLMSFTNRIEAHWTAAIIPLLMVATYPLILENQITRKWFVRLALPMVILFFVFRAYIALDFIPNVGKIKAGFYKRKELALEIQKMAGGRKVASFNNYVFPSNYQFYTGDTAIHLASPGYRFCQYDLWDDEQFAEGDSLLIILPKGLKPDSLVKLCNGQNYGVITETKFQSLKNLQIENPVIEKQNGRNYLTVSLSNKSGRTIKYDDNSRPMLGYMQKGIELSSVNLAGISEKTGILPGETQNLRYVLPSEGIDTKIPLIIYTKTTEGNRGEISSAKFDN